MTIEEIVRYTTWWHHVEESIIPLYFGLCLFFFLFWYYVSNQLIKSSSKSLQNYWNDTGSNLNVGLDRNLAIVSVETSSVGYISSQFSLKKSQCLLQTPFFRQFLVILLAVFVIADVIAVWLISGSIISRIELQLHGSISLVLICVTLLFFMSDHFPKLSKFFDHRSNYWAYISALRYRLTKTINPYYILYFQIAISMLCCMYITYTFATNEPLTRPVPTSGLVQHLCSSESPEIPFEETWRNYISLHEQILKSPKKDQRLLVYRAEDEGLGNRLEGLVSAFIFAVVTNRALLVQWDATPKCKAQLSELFQVPFKWQPYWPLADDPDHVKLYFGYCRACPLRGRTPDVELDWEGLVCSPDGGLEPTRRTVRVASTQWFAAALALNPHVRPKICSLFGPNMFTTAAKYLLNLSPQVKNQLQEFKSTHSWNEGKVISMQIRRLEGFGMSEDHAQMFLKCASMLSKDDKTKFFLATDHQGTKDAFKSMLGERLLTVDQPFDRGSLAGVRTALLEMFLLGEANEIISTPYSTFGDVSYARTGLIPYRVGRNGQCTKQLTSQPCFFYYFGLQDFSCWNQNMIVAEMTNQENCYV